MMTMQYVTQLAACVRRIGIEKSRRIVCTALDFTAHLFLLAILVFACEMSDKIHAPAMTYSSVYLPNTNGIFHNDDGSDRKGIGITTVTVNSNGSSSTGSSAWSALFADLHLADKRYSGENGTPASNAGDKYNSAFSSPLLTPFTPLSSSSYSYSKPTLRGNSGSSSSSGGGGVVGGGSVNGLVLYYRLINLLQGPILIPTLHEYVLLAAAMSREYDGSLATQTSAGQVLTNLLYPGALHFAPRANPEVRDLVSYLNGTFPSFARFTAPNPPFVLHESEDEAVKHISRHPKSPILALIVLNEVSLERVDIVVRQNTSVLPSTDVVLDIPWRGLDRQYQSYLLGGFMTVEKSVNDWVFHRLFGNRTINNETTAATSSSSSSSNGNMSTTTTVDTDEDRGSRTTKGIDNTGRDYITSRGSSPQPFHCESGTSPDFFLAPFPTAAYSTNAFYVRIKVLGFALVLATLYPFSRLVQCLVEEKESRMKETLKIMGLHGWVYHCSWYMYAAVQFSFVAASTLIIVSQFIFLKSSFSLLAVYFFAFCFCQVHMAFLISSFFNNAKIAALVAPVAAVACMLPKFAFANTNYNQAYALKVIACLLPHTAFAFGANMLSDFEYSTTGVHMHNLHLFKFNFGTVLGMLLLDCILYAMLAVYCGYSVVGQYGATQERNATDFSSMIGVALLYDAKEYVLKLCHHRRRNIKPREHSSHSVLYDPPRSASKGTRSYTSNSCRPHQQEEEEEEQQQCPADLPEFRYCMRHEKCTDVDDTCNVPTPPRGAVNVRKKKHPVFGSNNRKNNSKSNSKNNSKKEEEKEEKERYCDGDVQPLPAECMTRAKVIIRHLSKVYPSGKVAVKDVSLCMLEGQITCLLGHNGAGKSSLISLLTGLTSIAPGAGNVTVYGMCLRTQLNNIRKITGVCPQQNILFDYLTVEEHLMFFGSMKQRRRSTSLTLTSDNDDDTVALRALSKQLLADVFLVEARHRLIRDLDGGTKRKVCLAIALIGDPKFLLIDECTSGMDEDCRRSLWSTLRAHKKNRVLLLTTHYLDEAEQLADRLIVMSAGRVKCSGSCSYIRQQYSSGPLLRIVLSPPSPLLLPLPPLSSASSSSSSSLSLRVKGGDRVQALMNAINAVDQRVKLLSEAAREVTMHIPPKRMVHSMIESTASASTGACASATIDKNANSNKGTEDSAAVSLAKAVLHASLLVASEPVRSTIKSGSIGIGDSFFGNDASSSEGLQQADTRRICTWQSCSIRNYSSLEQVLTTLTKLTEQDQNQDKNDDDDDDDDEDNGSSNNNNNSRSNRVSVLRVNKDGLQSVEDTTTGTHTYCNAATAATVDTTSSAVLAEGGGGGSGGENNGIELVAAQRNIGCIATSSRRHASLQQCVKIAAAAESIAVAHPPWILSHNPDGITNGNTNGNTKGNTNGNTNGNANGVTVDFTTTDTAATTTHSPLLLQCTSSSSSSCIVTIIEEEQLWENGGDTISSTSTSTSRGQVHTSSSSFSSSFSSFFSSLLTAVRTCTLMACCSLQAFLRWLYTSLLSLAMLLVIKTVGHNLAVRASVLWKKKLLVICKNPSSVAFQVLLPAMQIALVLLLLTPRSAPTGHSLRLDLHMFVDKVPTTFEPQSSFPFSPLKSGRTFVAAALIVRKERSAEAAVRSSTFYDTSLTEKFSSSLAKEGVDVIRVPFQVARNSSQLEVVLLDQLEHGFVPSKQTCEEGVTSKERRGTRYAERSARTATTTTTTSSSRLVAHRSTGCYTPFGDKAMGAVIFDDTIVIQSAIVDPEVRDLVAAEENINGNETIDSSSSSWSIDSAYTLLYNASSPHSIAAISQQFVATAYKTCVESSLTGNNSSKSAGTAGTGAGGGVFSQINYSLKNHPLPVPLATPLETRLLLSFLMCLFIVIPLCYVPSAFVSSIVRERVNMCKHLQQLAGVSPPLYWVATLLGDMTIFCLLTAVVGLTLAVFKNSGAQAFSYSINTLLCVMWLIVSYGAASIPLGYLISLTTDNDTSAQVTAMAVNCVGILFLLLHFLLESESYAEKYSSHVTIVLRLSPTFNLGEALININTFYFARTVLGSNSADATQGMAHSTPFSWNIAGRNIFNLSVQSGVFFAMLLLTEVALLKRWYHTVRAYCTGCVGTILQGSINNNGGHTLSDGMILSNSSSTRDSRSVPSRVLPAEDDDDCNEVECSTAVVRNNSHSCNCIINNNNTRIHPLVVVAKNVHKVYLISNYSPIVLFVRCVGILTCSFVGWCWVKCKRSLQRVYVSDLLLLIDAASPVPQSAIDNDDNGDDENDTDTDAHDIESATAGAALLLLTLTGSEGPSSHADFRTKISTSSSRSNQPPPPSLSSSSSFSPSSSPFFPSSLPLETTKMAVQTACCESRHALNGATLVCAGGDRVGLSGSSGGGKTSLMNILAGFTAPTTVADNINNSNKKTTATTATTAMGRARAGTGAERLESGAAAAASVVRMNGVEPFYWKTASSSFSFSVSFSVSCLTRMCGSLYTYFSAGSSSSSSTSPLIGYCPQLDPVLSETLNAYELLRFYSSLLCVGSCQNSNSLETSCRRRSCSISNRHDDESDKAAIHLTADGDGDGDRVERLIYQLGLSHCASAPCCTYSGGNMRKVALALALIGKPQIYLLDEPSRGVDAGARMCMWSVLDKEIAEQQQQEQDNQHYNHPCPSLPKSLSPSALPVYPHPPPHPPLPPCGEGKQQTSSSPVLILVSHCTQELEAVCNSKGIMDRGTLNMQPSKIIEKKSSTEFQQEERAPRRVQEHESGLEYKQQQQQHRQQQQQQQQQLSFALTLQSIVVGDQANTVDTDTVTISAEDATSCVTPGSSCMIGVCFLNEIESSCWTFLQQHIHIEAGTAAAATRSGSISTSSSTNSTVKISKEDTCKRVLAFKALQLDQLVEVVQFLEKLKVHVHKGDGEISFEYEITCSRVVN